MTNLEAIRLISACCLAIPFFVTLALTPVSMRAAPRIGAVDVPEDDRRMHDKPIPCFGGMAIFAGVIVTIVLIKLFFFKEPVLFPRYGGSDAAARMTGMIAGGAAIFLTGVIDDTFGLKPLVKLACQIGCAVLAFAFGLRIPAIKLLGLQFGGSSMESMIASFIITVIWIVAFTNMVNLIDGMDGLASGVTGIAALSIAYTGYIHGSYDVSLGMCAIAGAAIGFLPYNFYPARSFMGDSGAMFLGYMLGVVSVGPEGPAKGATLISIVVPVLVLGVPFFDVLFAILRRARKGLSIFSADKGHLHHQLVYIGMGQRRTVLMLYGISSVMGIAAILFSRKLYLESIFLFCVALLFIFVLIWKWNNKK
jgi:UDP-GlcNAc:undecaprenyl-phosphate GlcNAc-1-phosphate transferase